VGGLVVLIAVLCAILFCLHRKKKAKKDTVHNPPPPPPAELADSGFPQEMSTPNVGKYNAPHPNELPAYSGFDATQSGATNYDQSSSQALNPSQAYNPTSPSLNSYGSPQSSGFVYASQSPMHSPNTADIYHPSDAAAYDQQQGLWKQQSNPQQTAEGGRPRQVSYPSPPLATASPVQQSQTYYPPPQAAHESHNFHSEQRGSPVGTQYSGDAHYGNDMSTSTTPAQFYTQHGHESVSRSGHAVDDNAWEGRHGHVASGRM
jgi:hypothetical protein